MQSKDVIQKSAIDRRYYWIDEIVRLSGSFESDSARVEQELNDEISNNGVSALLDHLRLCGSIPESYGHDSSEEKLYSKYTDALLSAAYNRIGLKSVVLTERGDAADVEVLGDDFSFVADAKVFRLSRTAKNQKDFKVQAMDGWKYGKPYAMVVCPLYQLPSRASQIYQQAATRNVCVFSYSHLSVIVGLAEEQGKSAAIEMLHTVFKTVEALSPSKDAGIYWSALNRSMLDFSESVPSLWNLEKRANHEAMELSKEHALEVLAKERENIMRLSKEEAIQKLIEHHRLDSRAETIKRVSDNYLLDAN